MVGIPVSDPPLETIATSILATIKAVPAVDTASIVQALDAINISLQQAIVVIATSIAPKTPVSGKFNPPVALLKTKPVEVIMSVLELEVGQTAGPQKMTFDEPTPPADGAVSSDNPAVATITLDPTDHESWTVVALSVGVANMSYTGTSALPDVGPAVVPNMVVTVVAVPVAEHGDFNPAGAPISGP